MYITLSLTHSNTVPISDNIKYLYSICRTNGTDPEEALLDEVPRIAAEFSLNALGIFVFGFIHMSCWVLTADRQTRVVRREAFSNILRQHTGYFDKNKSGALVTKLTE